MTNRFNFSRTFWAIFKRNFSQKAVLHWMRYWSHELNQFVLPEQQKNSLPGGPIKSSVDIHSFIHSIIHSSGYLKFQTILD